MGVVITIIDILVVLFCGALIAVVLMQREKSSSMSALTGVSEDPFVKQGKATTRDDKLANLTKYLAAICAVLILAAVILGKYA